MQIRRIAGHQLGQSSTQPDSFHPIGPHGGYFGVGVFPGGGGRLGGLVDASGCALRFTCEAEVRCFCARFNRAEKARVRRLASNGLL
jgi:hypothetical protein